MFNIARNEGCACIDIGFGERSRRGEPVRPCAHSFRKDCAHVGLTHSISISASLPSGGDSADRHRGRGCETSTQDRERVPTDHCGLGRERALIRTTAAIADPAWWHRRRRNHDLACGRRYRRYCQAARFRTQCCPDRLHGDAWQGRKSIAVVKLCGHLEMDSWVVLPIETTHVDVSDFFPAKDGCD